MSAKPISASDQYKIIFFLIIFTPTVLIGVGVIPAVILIYGFVQMKKRNEFSFFEVSAKWFNGYCLLLIVFGFLFSLIIFFTKYLDVKSKYDSYNSKHQEFTLSYNKKIRFIEQKLVRLKSVSPVERYKRSVSPLERHKRNLSPLEKHNIDFKHNQLVESQKTELELLRNEISRETNLLYSAKIEVEGVMNNILLILFCSSIPLLYMLAFSKLFFGALLNNKTWAINAGFISSRKRKKKTKGNGTSFNIINRKNISSYSVADELLKWSKLKEDGAISEQEFEEAKNKIWVSLKNK